MKKSLLILSLVLFFFSSCSISRSEPPIVPQSHSEQIEISKSSQPASPCIYSGESYKDLCISTNRINIGGANVILPILPTAELQEILTNKLTSYVDSLPLLPVGITVDFYCEEMYTTRCFTFYIVDSVELYNLKKMSFSYNTETLMESKLRDFFDKDTYKAIIDKNLNGDESLCERFEVNEFGIRIFTADKDIFIDNKNINTQRVFSVNFPEQYQPVLNNNEKYVALTFDDGPNPYTTPKLIEMLDKKGVKATFFMVGINIAEYKSTVKKVFDAGHDVGMHSYRHGNFYTMKDEDIITDLDSCSDLLYSITKKRPYLVRAPYGNINESTIKQTDYFFVNWNVDPLDWKLESAEQIAEEVLKFTHSGSIILMHDIYNTSCEAAEIVIDKLLSEGYRFVTISEYFDLNGKKSDKKLHFFREDYNVK